MCLLTFQRVKAANIPRAKPVSDLSDVSAFSIPTAGDVTAQAARKAEIEHTRANFTYGPDIVGGGAGPFYPDGAWGLLTSTAQLQDLYPELEGWKGKIDAGVMAAIKEVAAAGGLKTLDDYKKLYETAGIKSLIPKLPYEGYLANGETDSLFAMSRLSVNPYSLRRLSADEDVDLKVEDADAIKLSTMTQAALQKAGRLFYIDYRRLSTLPLQEGRHAAACDALFYQHPATDEFLPLAVRPNLRGAPDLVYTPLDEHNDWLLAKMMFNQNDLWHASFYHLAATHEVIDITYMAAVRSLSRVHPVFGMLTRFARGCFAIRELFIKRLINKGGPIDTAFAWSGTQAGNYTDDTYYAGGGSFSKNYFLADLRARGLLPDGDKADGAHAPAAGPKLKHFPYYEDASVVYEGLASVLTAFVEQYYDSDEAVVRDAELQAWVREANGDAKILDFPSSLSTRGALVEALTHVAYLSAIKHNTLNTNVPVFSTAVVPFNPGSFFAPLPTRKGTVHDLVPLLPPLEIAATQIGLLLVFSRPFYAGTARTLENAFDFSAPDDGIPPRLMGGRSSPANAQARRFKRAMRELGERVRARKLGSDGRSQGMPFVWTAFDTALMPFYAAI